MTKQKTFLVITLGAIAGFLLYIWTVFLMTDFIATWRHYLALALFIILVILFFKKLHLAIVGTGVYLIFGICNLLTLTQEVNTSWIKIFSLQTPPVNLLSLGIFCLYFILNFDALVNMYLDHKEKQSP